MPRKSKSPTQRAFKRFFRNIPGVFGGIVIIISIFLAILGYLITPDSTPSANDQVLQINNKPPGFKVMMLERKKNKQHEEVNRECERVFGRDFCSFLGKPISRMIFGEMNEYELIPINGYSFQEDKIIIQEYKGAKDLSEEKEIKLIDIVYSISGEVASVTNGQVVFKDYNKNRIKAGIEELQKRVEQEHIDTQKFLFGTDRYGRDILSRLIIGVRISLSVGIVAVIISLVIGIILGALAGYFQSASPKVRVFSFIAWLLFTYLILHFLVLFFTAMIDRMTGLMTLSYVAGIVFHFIGGKLSQKETRLFRIKLDKFFKLPALVSYLIPTIILVNATIGLVGENGLWRRFLLLLLLAGISYLISRFLIKKRVALPIDDVVMWFINVAWSIPTLLLVFALTIALGQDFWQIFVAVGLTMWVDVARIVRGQVLGIKETQYIEAAQSLGYSHYRTIRLHILPNILGPLTVVAAANFAYAILIEAGLSFLGIGVQPPAPSWGGMLNENYSFIISGNPWLAIIPGLAIMLMVLAFNLVGNGLRDALDVRTNL